MKISIDAWRQTLNLIETNAYTDNHLDLSGLALTTVNIKQLAAALEHNTSITSLDLHNNKIGDSGLKVLASNTTLTSLDVSHNLIAPDAVAIAKEKAANELLISLGLEPTFAPTFPGLEALAKNTSLTSLSIADNAIGLEGAQILATKALSHLNIANNHVGPQGAEAIAANKTITHLDISRNYIEIQGARALAENTVLKHLKVDLYGNLEDGYSTFYNEIGEEGLALLTDPNTQLTILDVGYARHDNNKWQKLITDIETNQYTESHLELNHLALHGLHIKQLINALEKNTYITSLDLSHNSPIAKGGIYHYRDPIHLLDSSVMLLAKNTTLTSLDLSDNQLTYEAVTALAANKTLLSLKLSASQMHDDALNDFMSPDSTLIDLYLADKFMNYELIHLKDNGLNSILDQNTHASILDLDIPAAIVFGEANEDAHLIQMDAYNDSLQSSQSNALVQDSPLPDVDAVLYQIEEANSSLNSIDPNIEAFEPAQADNFIISDADVFLQVDELTMLLNMPAQEEAQAPNMVSIEPGEPVLIAHESFINGPSQDLFFIEVIQPDVLS